MRLGSVPLVALLIIMKGEGRSRRDESASFTVTVEADVEGGEKPLPPQRSFATSAGRSRWGRSVLWAVLAVVLIECAFIVRLDVLNTPAIAVYSSREKLPNPRTESSSLQESGALELPIQDTKNATDVVASDEGKEEEEEVIETAVEEVIEAAVEEEEHENGVCSQEWLEKADRVAYSRDFTKQPVLVTMSETEVFSIL